MSDEAKVISMLGVRLNSLAGLIVDQTIADCVGRYTHIVIIGKLPDGSIEANSPHTCETALWMLERAKKIVMD
jgi:hypothetical protein